MKIYLALFLIFIRFSSFAADQAPFYEREDVPTSAKITSALWTIGGAVGVTAATLWKVAPLHPHMEIHEYVITAGLTTVSLFGGAVFGAYTGKKIGQYIDPSLQYFRARNWFVRKVTSGLKLAWDISSYYGMHAMYKWDDIRRTHLQGTFFELKPL